MPRVKDQEITLKAASQKWFIMYKQTPTRLKLTPSRKNEGQKSMGWHIQYAEEGEKTCQWKILYPAKLSFKNKGEN